MAKQLNLNIYTGKRGGRRPDSGRTRMHSKGVAHRARESINRLTAVHINFKVTTYFQNKPCLAILHKAFENSRSHGLNIVFFALQSNHVHLIIEVRDSEVLTRGMRSLTITFAKGIKRLKRHEGNIQIERYHLHTLKSHAEVLNALKYVLYNQAHHTGLGVTPDFCHALDAPNGFLLRKVIESFKGN